MPLGDDLKKTDTNTHTHTRIDYTHPRPPIITVDKHPLDGRGVGYPGCYEIYAALLPQAGCPTLDGQLWVDDAELADQVAAGQGVTEDTRTLDVILGLLTAFPGLLGLLLLKLALPDIVGIVGGSGGGSVVARLDLEVALLLFV